MNEHAAREVVLIRAIESADSERAIFTNDDRAYAGRAAAELARWQATERRQPASAEAFIGKRAELLANTLTRRAPALAQTARAFNWPAWIGLALPALALAAGALIEHIADRQHVNILAFPLLAIVLWNVIVYALLAISWVLRATGADRSVDSRGPRRWITAIGKRLPRANSGPVATAIDAFVSQWSTRVASLMAARAARVLHLAAALFAIGAIGGLYVRGLVFEYRAGWESTFLDAPVVHAILSLFLSPAAHWIGMPFPGVDEVAAMRFANGAPNAASANAARWIHLYAITVAAVVVVPRLVLALVARLHEQRRMNAFSFDLNEPYFRRLTGAFGGAPVSLRVIPYSFTVDEAAHDGLRTIARALLGDEAAVTLHAPVAFGAEESINDALIKATHPAALTLALFSLAATPEPENHGVFLKMLRSTLGSQPAVLVDESGYRQRLGSDSSAERRLGERRDAWRYFCKTAGTDVVFNDLSAPDLAAIERDFEHAVSATPAASDQ